MNIFLQIALSLTIFTVGLFFINCATRMIEYYEYQDKFSPTSKRYHQYVCFNPDAKIKYDLRIVRISMFTVTESPIGTRKLRRVG